MTIENKILTDNNTLIAWENIDFVFDNTFKFFEEKVKFENQTSIPTLEQYVKMQRVSKNIKKKILNLKNAIVEIRNDLKVNIQQRENENLIIQNGINNLMKNVTTVTEAFDQIKLQKAIQKSAKNLKKLEAFAERNFVYLNNALTKKNKDGLEIIAYANFYYGNKNITFDFDNSLAELLNTQSDSIPQTILDKDAEERQKFLESLKTLNVIVANSQNNSDPSAPMEEELFAQQPDKSAELLRMSQQTQAINQELAATKMQLEYVLTENAKLNNQISTLTNELNAENKKNKKAINKTNKEIDVLERQKQQLTEEIGKLNLEFDTIKNERDATIKSFKLTIANSAKDKQNIENFISNLFETLRWEKSNSKLTNDSRSTIWDFWKRTYEEVKEQYRLVCDTLNEESTLDAEFCEKLNDKLQAIYQYEEQLWSSVLSENQKKRLNSNESKDEEIVGKRNRTDLENDNSLLDSIDSDSNMNSDNEI